MTCEQAGERLSLALDGRLSAAERAQLDAHMAGCARCRALAAAFESEQAMLAAAWTPVAAPAGMVRTVQAQIRPRAHARRTTRRRLLIGAALAGLTAVALSPALAGGLDGVLERVGLVEREQLDQPERRLPVDGLTLEEARRRVAWPVLTLRGLPEGYALQRVELGELHAAADGPTVILHYGREGQAPASTGQAADVRLVQLKVREGARVEEPVAPGAGQAVDVGGRPGLLIDGEWAGAPGASAWERGRLLRLVLEDGDVVRQIEVDPRAGWDAARLIALGAALR